MRQQNGIQSAMVKAECAQGVGERVHRTQAFLEADGAFERAHHHVPAGIAVMPLVHGAFYVGKDALHAILSEWLPRLDEECEAYLVVSKDLGADTLLKWMQQNFTDLASERIETAKGFRILRAARL